MANKISELVGKTGHAIAECCKVAFCVGLVSLSYLSMSNNNSTCTTYGRLNYGDAVQAIMSSDMFSNDKTKAIGMIKQSADSAYYSAVIAIVKSDMFSCNKLKSIENISK